ncbi:MAG: AhpC/TSA family protein, partial [Deltaproteobacteria bacterium]
MSLQEQLTARKQEARAQSSPEVKDTQLRDLKKLAESGIIEAAPKVGDSLKDFELPNHRGEITRLADLRQKGPVVVTFYRGGWCPYCNLELRAYQQVLPQIKEAG